MSYRLGILVTHPIQYYVPWFRYLAQRMDVEVFYAHRQDATGQGNAGFGIQFEWDTPLLEGYNYRWLRNVAPQPTVRKFNGCDTPEIYEIIRTGRFDAFLNFGWNRKSMWQAIFACWRNKVPVIVRGDSQLQSERSKLKLFAKYLPYRMWLPRINAHLYVGQRNKEYLEYYGVPQKRLFFAPHFVDNTLFAAQSKQAITSGMNIKIREELGIPQDAFVVLYVGKFIPVKRPDDFIRACILAMEQSQDKKIHCLLIGLGPLHHELEGLASSIPDRIHFAGFRNQSEMPALYTSADLLVLPGRETWGMVVNEAMSCGLPSIVSDTAGCSPDLISDNLTGFTYPVGKIEALALRILEMRHRIIQDHDAVRRALDVKIHSYSFENATLGLEQALAQIT